MKITINGEPLETGVSNLKDLVEALGFEANKIALEVGGELVARANWGEFALYEGAKIEIVRFVGGG